VEWACGQKINRINSAKGHEIFYFRKGMNRIISYT
jgi:hypothetical protein